jgi:hypothetical protein
MALCCEFLMKKSSPGKKTFIFYENICLRRTNLLRNLEIFSNFISKTFTIARFLYSSIHDLYSWDRMIFIIGSISYYFGWRISMIM